MIIKNVAKILALPLFVSFIFATFLTSNTYATSVPTCDFSSVWSAEAVATALTNNVPNFDAETWHTFIYKLNNGEEDMIYVQTSPAGSGGLEPFAFGLVDTDRAVTFNTFGATHYSGILRDSDGWSYWFSNPQSSMSYLDLPTSFTCIVLTGNLHYTDAIDYANYPSFTAGWSGPEIFAPATLPPVTVGANVRLDGLTVYINPAGLAGSPGDIVDFEYDFLDNDTWISSASECPVYESENPGWYIQDLDCYSYTYETAGTYDIGVVAVDSWGADIWNYVPVTVGVGLTGTFYSPVGPNTYAEALPCDLDFDAFGFTDVTLATDLFCPSTDISTTLEGTFNIGVLNPSISAIKNLFSGFIVTEASCDLELGDFVAVGRSFHLQGIVDNGCDKANQLHQTYPIFGIMLNFILALSLIGIISHIINSLLHKDSHNLIVGMEDDNIRPDIPVSPSISSHKSKYLKSKK